MVQGRHDGVGRTSFLLIASAVMLVVVAVVALQSNLVVRLPIAVLAGALALTIVIVLIPRERMPPWVKYGSATFVAVVGVLAAVPGLLGGGSSTAGPEERIAACSQGHDIPATQPIGAGKHESCRWPPAKGAKSDGYCRIDVVAHVPDRPTSDDQATVWSFASSAEFVAVEWWVAKSGNDHLFRQMRYRAGQIVDVDGMPTSLPADLADVESSRRTTTLLVAVPGGVYPRTVECT